MVSIYEVFESLIMRLKCRMVTNFSFFKLIFGLLLFFCFWIFELPFFLQNCIYVNVFFLQIMKSTPFLADVILFLKFALILILFWRFVVFLLFCLIFSINYKEVFLCTIVDSDCVFLIIDFFGAGLGNSIKTIS